MSMPRRHLSGRLTAAGLAFCVVVALGGCASMSTVPDQDFTNSSNDGSRSSSGSHKSGSSGNHDSESSGNHNSHNGTVTITSRHSQKVVVRNESRDVVHSTTMSRGEHVTYSLPPGPYTIVATSSEGVCVVTVSIHSSATTRVNVGC